MAVYFIKNLTSGDIKVGYSYQPAVRVKQVSVDVGEPCKLLACIPGTTKTERSIHRRFAEYRLNGEWFSPSPALVDFISEMRALYPKGHAAEICAPRTVVKRVKVVREKLKYVSRPPQNVIAFSTGQLNPSGKAIEVYNKLSKAQRTEIARAIRVARIDALTWAMHNKKSLSSRGCPAKCEIG